MAFKLPALAGIAGAADGYMQASQQQQAIQRQLQGQLLDFLGNHPYANFDQANDLFTKLYGRPISKGDFDTVKSATTPQNTPANAPSQFPGLNGGLTAPGSTAGGLNMTPSNYIGITAKQPIPIPTPNGALPQSGVTATQPFGQSPQTAATPTQKPLIPMQPALSQAPISYAAGGSNPLQAVPTPLPLTSSALNAPAIPTPASKSVLFQPLPPVPAPAPAPAPQVSAPAIPAAPAPTPQAQPPALPPRVPTPSKVTPLGQPYGGIPPQIMGQSGQTAQGADNSGLPAYATDPNNLMNKFGPSQTQLIWDQRLQPQLERAQAYGQSVNQNGQYQLGKLGEGEQRLTQRDIQNVGQIAKGLMLNSATPMTPDQAMQTAQQMYTDPSTGYYAMYNQQGATSTDGSQGGQVASGDQTPQPAPAPYQSVGSVKAQTQAATQGSKDLDSLMKQVGTLPKNEQVSYLKAYNNVHPDNQIPVPDGNVVPYYTPDADQQAAEDAKDADAAYNGQKSKYYGDYIKAIVGDDNAKAYLANQQAIVIPQRLQLQAQKQANDAAYKDALTRLGQGRLNAIMKDTDYKANYQQVTQLQTRADGLIMQQRLADEALAQSKMNPKDYDAVTSAIKAQSDDVQARLANAQTNQQAMENDYSGLPAASQITPLSANAPVQPAPTQPRGGNAPQGKGVYHPTDMKTINGVTRTVAQWRAEYEQLTGKPATF